VGRTACDAARAFVKSDHPHACGENEGAASGAASDRGPSPRMWGELDVGGADDFGGRTIPTHVGRTFRLWSVARNRADHPHACGENDWQHLFLFSFHGPSPRMWGELRSLLIVVSGMRTIPTHVGRTYRGSGIARGQADHPHACGENRYKVTRGKRSIGPSPRMWGEPCLRRWATSDVRTIPTHVGRTECFSFYLYKLTDHPHACGENASESFFRSNSSGPSPRMWGELSGPAGARESVRTIPTHVGRTNNRLSRQRTTADHPHACGENHVPTAPQQDQGGPSPRMWGELGDRPVDAHELRTIPTHVGRTCCRGSEGTE